VVWKIIKNHESSDDIQKKILNTEMQDILCKCFTERLSRLVNYLNGFDPSNENFRLANIIILIRNKYEMTRKTKARRCYDKQKIDDLLFYLE